MEKQELRAASALAAVFSVRLLGLFMIYPVFAAYARTLSGASPYLIGEALGIYGLSQGIFQIPFGLLSDRIGRKVMIVFGLILFGLGSAVAALSSSIGGVIVGRALQGGGAVGSVILALVADLTKEENRTKAMALVGITIGGSFMIAFVLGPIVAHFVGVPGIFWLMVLLALAGIAITEFAVPNPRLVRVHRDAEAVPALIGRVLRNKELLRTRHRHIRAPRHVDGEFSGRARALARHAGLAGAEPVARLPSGAHRFGRADAAGDHCCREASAHERRVCRRCGGARRQPGDALSRCRKYLVVLAALVVFFSAFNVLEASLPSLITKVAPPDAKGTATGLYSSLQFLGIFVGGVVGGYVHQHGGEGGVFVFTTALALCWLLAAATMAPPSYLTTRLVPIADDKAADAESLAARLRQVPGVAEAVVIADEKLAYLKVDSRVFDAAKAQTLTGAA